MIAETDWIFDHLQPLSNRLSSIHSSIIEKKPAVDRIACALYDSKTDLVKTFINSTHKGKAITGYEYKLSDSESLTRLAANKSCRVIHDIQASLQPTNGHSKWLLEQNYQSSFTVPMFSGARLLGFVFFDSHQNHIFTKELQRNLILYAHLMEMTIASEHFAVKALLATASAARDFAELRDFETGMHLDRMAQFSRIIAKGVAKKFNLTDEFIEHVYLFAPLHDIGKIGIPDEILLKPDKLNAEERIIMESHVEKGVSILNKVLDDYELSHLSDSQMMLNIVGSHHEYCDGTGYPHRLTKDQIPIEARIVTVADIFDALANKRPYKDPWQITKSFEELDHMVAIGKIDADCVMALKAQTDQAKVILATMLDEDI